jgi:hypothetical protein
MSKEHVFNKLKLEITDAIDGVFSGNTWVDDQPCIVPSNISYRMAEAAMAVLRVACEQEEYLLSEGYHVESNETEV